MGDDSNFVSLPILEALRAVKEIREERVRRFGHCEESARPDPAFPRGQLDRPDRRDDPLAPPDLELGLRSENRIQARNRR